MAAFQVSLWLLPPPVVGDRLEANICELSRKYGGIPFLPHVTVMGGILCESSEEVVHLTEKLKKGLEGIGEIPCHFQKEIASQYNRDDSLVWNQACVSILDTDHQRDGFVAFHERVSKILERDGEFPSPLCKPHLSHFYGTGDEPPPLEDVLVSPDFDSAEMALWETSGGCKGVKNWKELARIKLC